MPIARAAGRLGGGDARAATWWHKAHGTVRVDRQDAAQSTRRMVPLVLWTVRFAQLTTACASPLSKS